MRKRISAVIVCAATLFLIFVTPVTALDTEDYDRTSFEEQGVMDDLGAVLSSDKIQEYKDGAKTVYNDALVLHTMEFGYISRDLSDFGFYIYVYDPVCGADLTSVTAQMCLLESTSSQYKEYGCTMLSKDGYFSKHRVELGDNATMLNWSERVYKISGITVESSKYIKDCYVGTKYTYTGNMKGYGSEIDTLTCRIFAQDTIMLYTEFTYYRTTGSSKGLYWQNQINTVYFSVPNTYVEDYGKLSAIYHSYKEYETGPMVVTNSALFGPYMQSLYESNKAAAFEEGQYAISDFEKREVAFGSALDYTGSFAFNYSEVTDNKLFTKTIDSPFVISGDLTMDRIMNFTSLPFWFYDPNLASRENNEVAVTSDDIFNFISSHPMIYTGTFEELTDHAIEKYPYAEPRPGVTVNGKPLDNTEANKAVDATRLHYISTFYGTHFTEILDEYNGVMDFRDSSNIKTLLSYDISHTTYQKIQDFGLFAFLFGNAYVKGDETISNIHPLAVIEESDLSLSDADFSRKYLVNKSDVSKIKWSYNNAKSKGETLFLFRFDISDYFAKSQKVYYYDTFMIDEWKEDVSVAMVCRQSYYADFDIIALTFDKDGVETIIPVVHTPKDFIGDITTPSEVAPPINWSALISVACVIVILFVFRKPISKTVGAVCSGTGKVIKSMTRRTKRPEDNSENPKKKE